MTPAQIAQLHTEILKQLYEASPLALPERALHGGMLFIFPELQLKDFYREIEYLKGKNFVASQPHATSPGLLSWKLTASGVEHVRREKIA